MKNQFYNDLPSINTSVHNIFDHSTHFHDLPESWFVINTDVKKSTEAIKQGKHTSVNLVATASIIAVLNIAKDNNLEVPFFFGGDGGTLLIPFSMVDEVMEVLSQLQEISKKEYNLDLRKGAVPVSKIYNEGHKIQLAKVEISRGFSIPVVLGYGIIHAEDLIKKDEYDTPTTPSQNTSVLNLEGMECKWKGIPPIKPKEEIICLIINIIKPENQRQIYSTILREIEEIYGSSTNRNPVTTDGLSLSLSPSRAQNEMILKSRDWKLYYFIKSYLTSLFGKIFYFRFSKSGKRYLKRLTELADVLHVDGRISTVIAGTEAQRNALKIVLDELEKEGNIVYGEKVNAESIMSCYVMDLVDRHIHFIDGSEGGYTEAASILKQKLQNLT